MSSVALVVESFSPATKDRHPYLLLDTATTTTKVSTISSALFSSSSEESSSSFQNQNEISQWDLFLKYHAPAYWNGLWSTYDHQGTLIDETVGAVEYHSVHDENGKTDTIQQTHYITIGASRANCQTWMRTKSTQETRSFPVAQYSAANHLQQLTLIGRAYINGPSLLQKSQLWSTELCLQLGDARVRVAVQQKASTESMPVVRILASRETIRDNPPWVDDATDDSNKSDSVKLFRSVPPSLWNQNWKGTSSQVLSRKVESSSTTTSTSAPPVLDESQIRVSEWHAREWSMRLEGGLWITVLTPKDSSSKETTTRLSWMPQDDTLLSVEAILSPDENTEKLKLDQAEYTEYESDLNSPKKDNNFRDDAEDEFRCWIPSEDRSSATNDSSLEDEKSGSDGAQPSTSSGDDFGKSGQPLSTQQPKDDVRDALSF